MTTVPATGGGSILLTIIEGAVWVLQILILVRVLFSWFRPSHTNAVYRYVYELTEPLLGPIRRVLPNTGMVDLSPLIALLLLSVVQVLVEQFIRGVL